MKKTIDKYTGSVALISVLAISSLVLILVVSMSELNLSTSKQHFNSISQKSSYYIGESCLEEAIIRLEADPSFSSETITLDAETNCDVTVSGNTISVTANFLNYTQTYQAQITQVVQGQATNIQLIDWKEI